MIHSLTSCSVIIVLPCRHLLYICTKLNTVWLIFNKRRKCTFWALLKSQNKVLLLISHAETKTILSVRVRFRCAVMPLNDGGVRNDLSQAKVILGATFNQRRNHKTLQWCRVMLLEITSFAVKLLSMHASGKKWEQVGKTTNTKMKPQRADDSWDVSS